MPAVESLFTGSKRGWDDLGSKVLGSAAATTGVLTIPARDVLLAEVRIVGYGGGGDIASFRFNGDNAANYTSRYLSSVAGGVVWVNNQNVSQTLARLFALVVGAIPRNALIGITNFATVPKVGNVNAQTGVASAATGLQLEAGGFQWQNTAAQITSIELLTAGGATMLAGTGFAVLGRNL